MIYINNEDKIKNIDLKDVSLEEEEVQVAATVEDAETPLDKNVRLMSPTRMLLRRFFRLKRPRRFRNIFPQWR